MSATLDYEELVEDFESSLMTKLRGHGPTADYLEMWVPDADPVKSILNMVEAAEAYGRDEIVVRVSCDTLPATRINELLGILLQLAQVEIQTVENGNLIRVTELKG